METYNKMQTLVHDRIVQAPSVGNFSSKVIEIMAYNLQTLRVLHTVFNNSTIFRLEACIFFQVKYMMFLRLNYFGSSLESRKWKWNCSSQ